MVSVVTPRLGSKQLRNWASVLEVSGSQFALAGTGYLTLVLGGRTLDAAGFATITSFYLLLNVVGRGLCSAAELELTRSVAHADRQQIGAGTACRAGIRHTVVMVVLAVLVVLATSPLLDRVFGGDPILVALLVLSLPGMAASHVLRGPLAGSRHYHPYAATFAVEATVVLLFGVVLAVLGITDVRWWTLGLAVGPLAATVAVGTPLRHAARRLLGSGGTSDSGFRELIAAVVILAGIQAAWNLPPVLLTAQTIDAPAIAAGFAAVSLILRVPALLFPAMQALALPVLAGRSQEAGVPRVRLRMLVLLGLLVAGWLVGAIALTPLVVRLTFGALSVPGTGVLAVLAVAAVVGTGAQLAQTTLVAHRRQSAAAAVCAVAVVALLVVFYLFPATSLAAAFSLLVALSVVLLGSVLVFWSN